MTVKDKRVDELVSLRETLEKYERVKKNNFVLVLGNLRGFKASDDEEGAKGQIKALLQMLPRYRAVIGEEIEKFSGYEEITSKLDSQIHIIDELEKDCNGYISTDNKNRLNAYYTHIFQIINNFIKFCDMITSTKIR